MTTPITLGLYQGKKPPYKYFHILRIDAKKKKVTITLGLSDPKEEYDITRIKSFGWIAKQLRKI